MKKNKKNRINAWNPTPRKLDAPALIAWCAALAVLFGAVILFSGDSARGVVQSDLVISEVMTANAAAWPTESGAFCDWVELWNRSDHTVRLSDYRLCKGDDVRGAYSLPEAELAPDARTVIYCMEHPEEGVFSAGITLSKNGATLVLLSADGSSSYVVDVPSLRKNESYSLQEDGSWAITEAFTPGLENTEAAHAQLQITLPERGPLYISELMASNGRTLEDADGDYPDWIEIHNGSDAPVRLRGWSLADGSQKWAFPDVTLGADEYLVVFASGKDRSDGESHTGFKLSAEGETLYLIDADGHIASTAQYDSLGKDVSLSRTESGSFTTSLAPSPGRANGAGAGEEGLALQPVSQNVDALYINEVVCAMSGGADWVELYNGGAAAVDLSGWWLSDKESHPRKWEFPQGASIEANGYYLVILSGDGKMSEAQSAMPRANFSLSLSGEALLLPRPDGTIVDQLALKNQKRNVSYGRVDGQANYRYLAEMTPGKANSGSSYAMCLRPVEFSREGGWTEGSVSVELSSPDGAQIYYTLDGSAPTTQSNSYSGPITVDSNTAIRAIAAAPDCMTSVSVSNTYIFDARSALRLVCVNGSAEELNAKGGSLNTGTRFPRSVSAEVYDYDGTRMIDQNCELVMVGSNTRTKDSYPQKAFRLRARGALGDDTKFRAKLFNDRDYEEYEAFVMRASGQDSRSAFMRDAVLTSLAEDTSVYYQEAEICVAYVNGKYWGVYYMRERVDEDSLCQFEGWDPDTASLDILRSKTMRVQKGSDERYNEMMKFVRENDFSKDETIEKLRGYCDIENYLEYVAFQIYTEQEDLSNVRVYRNANGDGLWRWAIFDMDFSFINDKNNVSTWLSSSGEVGSITQQSNVLFYKLMHNAKMRDAFLTRFGELLATSFSSENVVGKIQKTYEAIKEDMKNNTARWGWKYSTWEKQVAKIVDYAETRPARLMGFLKSGFNLSDAQMEAYFGAAIAKVRERQQQ